SSKAVDSKKEKDIKAANKLVEQLADGDLKVDLAEELVALEEAIEAKAAYDTAKAAVEKAVESGEKKDIEKAEELIEALADEKQRKELEGMLEEATPAESEQPKMGVFNLGLMG